MAQLIRTDGTVEELLLKAPATFTLQELQTLVGGYIERVRVNPYLDMIVNEEGLIKGLPINRVASTLVGQKIVGNVVVLEPEEWK